MGRGEQRAAAVSDVLLGGVNDSEAAIPEAKAGFAADEAMAEMGEGAIPAGTASITPLTAA